MPFMEFFAKNAGIRRAQGEYVLTTNADVLLGSNLMERLARGPLDHNTVYRATRRDLKPDTKLADAEKPDRWLFSHRTTPPYHAEGAGDFIMAAREVFEALRGFNETIRFAKLHKDTQFCIHAHKLCFNIEVVGDAYHLFHSNSWVHLPLSKRMRRDAPWGPPYDYKHGVPYLNGPDWGLVFCRTTRIRERVSRLTWTRRQGRSLAPCASTPNAANVLGEAGAAWRSARRLSLGEFNAEYVGGLARLTRSRPDPNRAAVAFLRRYIQTVWKQLGLDGTCRARGVALYGAGRHTEWLLGVVRDMPGPSVRYILDDFVQNGQRLHGIPIVRPSALNVDAVGAVVLSSDLHEEAMQERTKSVLVPAIPVVRLYEGLPRGLFTEDNFKG